MDIGINSNKSKVYAIFMYLYYNYCVVCILIHAISSEFSSLNILNLQSRDLSLWKKNSIEFDMG